MFEGIVIKATSGYYTVQSESGQFVCSLRGRLRKDDTIVTVGDRVQVEEVRPGVGVIETVFPRKSELIRPRVANVDQAVIVCALTQPEPDLNLLDRLLVVVDKEGIGAILCFNKADLVSEYMGRKIARPYRKAGYTALVTSAMTGKGVKRLKSFLKGKISVFAGPSGVGKSALANAIEPGLTLETGEISEKLGRGRHTTRHAQLLALQAGGFLVDTPGFSKLSLDGIEKEELRFYFPEFLRYEGLCRFLGCLHHREPDCAVRAALQSGEIARSRYDHYIQFLEEISAIGYEKKYDKGKGGRNVLE